MEHLQLLEVSVIGECAWQPWKTGPRSCSVHLGESGRELGTQFGSPESAPSF